MLEIPINNLLHQYAYSIYDIDYIQEKERNLLQFFIEKTDKSNINLEDCIIANNIISEYLDKNDPFESEYILEVTSPGIIRNLKKIDHFKQQIGKVINVELNKDVKGFSTTKLTAILTSVSEKYIIIDDIKIYYEDIKLAKSTYEF